MSRADKQRLATFSVKDLRLWVPPKHDVIIGRDGEDILIHQGLMIIYGKAGIGKSIVGYDLSNKISMGLNWLGFRTSMSKVWYLQTEMPQAQLKKRTDKHSYFHELEDPQVLTSSELSIKIDAGADMIKVGNTLEAIRPQVMFTDPLINAVSNNLVDTWQAGRIADVFNDWRNRYSVAHVIIHHPRQAEHKEGKEFNYGADEILGAGFGRWTDSVIWVEQIKEGDPIMECRLHFQKTRWSEHLIKPIDIIIDRRDLSVKRKEANRVLYPRFTDTFYKEYCKLKEATDA